jgi:hypothetical protein
LSFTTSSKLYNLLILLSDSFHIFADFSHSGQLRRDFLTRILPQAKPQSLNPIIQNGQAQAMGMVNLIPVRPSMAMSKITGSGNSVWGFLGTQSPNFKVFRWCSGSF